MTWYTILLVIFPSGTEALYGVYPSKAECGLNLTVAAQDLDLDSLTGFSVKCVNSGEPSGSIRPKSRNDK